MKKKEIFTVIFFMVLISYTVSEVAEGKESFNEATGSINPAMKQAPTQLRSRTNKLPVHPPSVIDSFSFNDDMIINALDGKDSSASKDALKPFEKNKASKHDKINKYSVSSKHRFAMRRAAKKHRMFDSSHDARMHPSASTSRKGKHRFVFPTTASSADTDEPFKTQIKTSLKLTIKPTGETVLPTVDTIDRDSKWILEKGDSTEYNEKEYSESDKDDSLPHGQPTVTEQQEPTQHAGTTSIPPQNMAVHPGMKTSEGPRWQTLANGDRANEGNESNKRVKVKRKKSHSKTEEETQSSSPAANLAGVFAGILMFLLIFNGVPRLWRIYKKRWRRRSDPQLGLNIPPAGYFSEELSEEEVIFDRTAMGGKKNSSKTATPDATPRTSPRWPTTTNSSYQPTDHTTQAQKIWILTDTPKSTPLMAVSEITDTPRAKVLNVNKIPESISTASLLTTSSLSESGSSTPAETSRSSSLTNVTVISLTSESAESLDTEISCLSLELPPACDQTETTASDPLPAAPHSVLVPTASSDVTISPSSSSSQPCTKESSHLYLHPASFDELKLTSSMETDHTSSSSESCKTPVAPRDEVVITMEDDDDEPIIYASEKSHVETIGTASFPEKEIEADEVVILMDGGDDEPIIYASSKSYGEISGNATFTEKEIVADEVVILLDGDDDDGEIIYTDEKFQGQVLLTLADTGDDASESKLGKTTEDIDKEGKSLIRSGFEYFWDDEPCYMGMKPEIQNFYKEETTDMIDNSQHGKSLIGEHKAWENRGFRKDLNLKQESTEFKGEPGTASLGEGKRLKDNNKANKRSKKHHTKERKHSLKKPILMRKNAEKYFPYPDRHLENPQEGCSCFFCKEQRKNTQKRRFFSKLKALKSKFSSDNQTRSERNSCLSTSSATPGPPTSATGFTSK